MTPYRLTPKARADLDGIWEYTIQTWSAAQAERYILAIRDACDALAKGRRTGRAIDDVRPGYRKRLVQSHVLFYRAAGDGEIEIIRILHQRMDVASRLLDAEPGEP